MTDRKIMEQALADLNGATELLRTRLAQPEQQPVPGVVMRYGFPTLLPDRDIKSTDVRLYTSPPQRKPLMDELLETLEEIAYGLESARVWGGMEFSYNPLHPYKYLPLRDKARAAIAKATGENT